MPRPGYVSFMYSCAQPQCCDSCAFRLSALLCFPLEPELHHEGHTCAAQEPKLPPTASKFGPLACAGCFASWEAMCKHFCTQHALNGDTPPSIPDAMPQNQVELVGCEHMVTCCSAGVCRGGGAYKESCGGLGPGISRCCTEVRCCVSLACRIVTVSVTRRHRSVQGP